jgi:hypothetical protein
LSEAEGRGEERQAYGEFTGAQTTVMRQSVHAWISGKTVPGQCESPSTKRERPVQPRASPLHHLERQ